MIPIPLGTVPQSRQPYPVLLTVTIALLLRWLRVPRTLLHLLALTLVLPRRVIVLGASPLDPRNTAVRPLAISMNETTIGPQLTLPLCTPASYVTLLSVATSTVPVFVPVRLPCSPVNPLEASTLSRLAENITIPLNGTEGWPL